MKIIHVVRGLANSSGLTHIVPPLAEAQAALGCQVKVLFVEKPNEPAVAPDPAIVESHCYPMTVRSRHYGWSRPFERAVREQVADTDIVHVHAVWNFPTWCAMREAKRASVPYIVAPQGSLEPWALNRTRFAKSLYAKFLEKPLFDRAACMQALTDAEASQCHDFGIRSPVRILPNGINLDVVDRCDPLPNLRRELSLPGDSKLLIFLSRIFPKKGLDLLLAGFADYAKSDSNAYLLIAGHDGGSGYLREIQQIVVDRKLEPRVRFLGELRGERKFQVLKSTDLFLLTSHSEGLPIAVLEAMACSLPVVITPGCHLPEVVEFGCGYIVNPAPDEITEAIRQALASGEALASKGARGRSLIVEKFTWPAIAKRSFEIYSDYVKARLAPAARGSTGPSR